MITLFTSGVLMPVGYCRVPKALYKADDATETEDNRKDFHSTHRLSQTSELLKYFTDTRTEWSGNVRYISDTPVEELEGIVPNVHRRKILDLRERCGRICNSGICEIRRCCRTSRCKCYEYLGVQESPDCYWQKVKSIIERALYMFKVELDFFQGVSLLAQGSGGVWVDAAKRRLRGLGLTREPWPHGEQVVGLKTSP